MPVACALGAEATFVGQGRLGARPLSPLSDEIIAAGCDLQGLGGFPLKTSGRMRPGTFVLPGNVSSQYISGLLLAAPLLAQPSCVQVTGLIESRPYINLTIQAMKAFGVEVNVERIPAKDGQPEVTNFRVSSGSYRTPGNVAVEGDWSNAAFWLCAGAIGTDPITVEGVSLSSAQGDRNVLAALSRFGARIVRSTNAATVQSDKLAGFEMSAHDIPDLVPVISAVASLAQGRTFIRDCARLRIKESDRLVTTTRELTALGAQVRIAGDDLIIKGVDAFTGGEVDSHNDHRIAMMAAIAATRLICERKLVMPSVSIRVQRLACRRKSPFPGLTVFMRQRYHTASAAVTIWPNTVATAAPIMPHLHSKMKMGSKMMLSTAPASVEIMANRGLPSARMTGFIA